MTSKPSHKEAHVLNKMLAAALSLGLIGVTIPAPAHAGDDGISQGRIKHVLLISVDGLHALDVANYVAAHPDSALAELSERALTYSNARTPANSDSFPGLLALVTGGSPNSHGLFYDVSYNRSIFDPTNTSCSGQPGNTQLTEVSSQRHAQQHHLRGGEVRRRTDGVGGQAPGL
jgi:predicted AlkP superfamily pyrophosphatase or phosphodiesterase